MSLDNSVELISLRLKRIEEELELLRKRLELQVRVVGVLSEEFLVRSMQETDPKTARGIPDKHSVPR